MRPDAQLVFWNIFNVCRGEGIDETKAHNIALGFLKAYGGSFTYVPKIDEFDRGSRNELIRELAELGSPVFLIAPHFKMSQQAIINVIKGDDDVPDEFGWYPKQAELEV